MNCAAVLMTALLWGTSATGHASTLPGTAKASRYANHVQLMAEGAVPPSHVLAVPLPSFPPLPPGLELRARYTFPYLGKDQLEVLVFVAPTELPVGVFDPEAAPPGSVVSRFVSRIEAMEIAGGEAYESRGLDGGIVMLGRVVEVLSPSPFGDLTGLLMVHAMGFIEGDEATFKLIGGTGAGDHATFSPWATGTLSIDRPWGSF